MAAWPTATPRDRPALSHNPGHNSSRFISTAGTRDLQLATSSSCAETGMKTITPKKASSSALPGAVNAAAVRPTAAAAATAAVAASCWQLVSVTTAWQAGAAAHHQPGGST